MAAVATDLTNLLKYLLSLEFQERKPVVEWLSEFSNLTSIRSILFDDGFDRPWATRGYLADLFQVVACTGIGLQFGVPPPAPVDGLNAHKFRPKWVERRCLPGPDVLAPKSFLKGKQEPDRSLNELDAAFISSGPFKFVLSSSIEEHLTIDVKRRVRLFYPFLGDLNNNLSGEYHFHHFLNLRCHTLSRLTDVKEFIDDSLLHVDEVLEEIDRTYSLLFTRKRSSIQIASNLFANGKISLSLPTGEYVHDNWQSGRESNYRLLKNGFESQFCIFPWKSVASEKPVVALFEIFGGRLIELQEAMKEWKPRAFSEFFIPGYSDGGKWYTAIFGVGVFFGIVGASGLVTTIIQTAVAILALGKQS